MQTGGREEKYKKKSKVNKIEAKKVDAMAGYKIRHSWKNSKSTFNWENTFCPTCKY